MCVDSSPPDVGGANSVGSCNASVLRVFSNYKLKRYDTCILQKFKATIWRNVLPLSVWADPRLMLAVTQKFSFRFCFWLCSSLTSKLKEYASEMIGSIIS